MKDEFVSLLSSYPSCFHLFFKELPQRDTGESRGYLSGQSADFFSWHSSLLQPMKARKWKRCVRTSDVLVVCINFQFHSLNFFPLLTRLAGLSFACIQGSPSTFPQLPTLHVINFSASFKLGYNCCNDICTVPYIACWKTSVYVQHASVAIGVLRKYPK